MFRNPANKNYLEAQTLIGVDYLNGNGVTQDYAQALDWFQKAASEDYAPAQNKIGCMYKNGYCVNQDQRKAFEWFQKAANQEYDEAQTNLALMYKEGSGVQQDYSKAIEWFRKAADQGNDVAKYNLELLNKKEPILTQEIDPTQNINEPQDKHTEEIIPDELLGIPFPKFFDNYFRDESKKLPLNAGGGVWFLESMSEEEKLVYIDRALKAQEAAGLEVPFALGALNIDTTTSQNLQEGIYLHFNDDESGYVIVLKNTSEDWDVVSELESAYYDESTQTLYINNYDIKTTDQVACYYAERFAECINAYLNQDDESQAEQTEDLYSYIVTDALDDIDGRISDIEEKIAMLSGSDEFFDEEQALLDSIHEVSEMISNIENYDSDDDNGADLIDLIEDFQKSIVDIYVRITDMNERDVMFENEQYIEDLMNSIIERAEAL